MLQNLISVETTILLWIQNNIRNEFLTAIFKFITTLGNGGIIWIMISVGLLIPKKTRKVGVLSLISLALSALIDNVILKNLIARTRPYDVIPELTTLVGAQKDYSFPSGHTGSAFAAAVVLFRGLPKKYGIPILIFAFLMGLSRLYVGVHYPSDVLGGMLIGTGIALFTYWLGTLIMDKRG